ncbi:MAG TPA: type II CAAX endopeptidase family protein [Bacteroidota bacterium]|mgnify:FL=1|nr:type II CAAX endopeptidase family protein [Bacteroidota bacterium]
MSEPTPHIEPEEERAPVTPLLREWTIHPAGFAVLVLALVFISYQLVGGLISFLLFGLDFGKNTHAVRVATMVSQYVLLLGPAVAMLYLQPWSIRQVLRLRWPRLGPSIAVIVSVLALQMAGQAWLEMQQFVLREYLLPDFLLPVLDAFEEMITELYSSLLGMHSLPEALFVWLVVGLTPALCEEGLFRGTVQYSFEKVLPARWAIVLSGGLFAAFHLNPVTLIPLTALGMWFSATVWRGKSIAYPVLGHAVNNTFAVVALYALDTEQLVPTSSGGALPFGPLLLILALALAVFAVFARMFWRMTAEPHADTM